MHHARSPPGAGSGSGSHGSTQPFARRAPFADGEEVRDGEEDAVLPAVHACDALALSLHLSGLPGERSIEPGCESQSIRVSA
jgi:hypothetical protein